MEESSRKRARSADSLQDTDNLRIDDIKPLLPPQILMEEIPLTEAAMQTVLKARREASNIILGSDDRLLVIVGPCSIHDVEQAKEYGNLLKKAREDYAQDLCLIMRVYFEKPRTTVGWKGLINDPFLDGSFKINKGLRHGRGLLLDLNEAGVPAGVEFLDTMTPQFLCDLVSWGAIGARTTESQVHRELASGLSMPVGFKNGTDGGMDVALDGVQAAMQPHHFLSVTKQGLAAIVATVGNETCHVILRGGSRSGPNYGPEFVAELQQKQTKRKLVQRCMIDCSHGNSLKDHRNQPKVAVAVAEQVAAGNNQIGGVMIESHINEGRQDIPSTPEGRKKMLHGVSVTDACVNWADTIPMLDVLAQAVRTRRGLVSQPMETQK